MPIVLAAAFAGCGTSEKERVRATIAADLRAQEREDWNAVCDLRTAAGRRELVRTSLRPDAKTCAEAWTLPTGDNEPILSFELKSAERRLADIDVDKNVASARYDDGFVQRLRKVRGRWLIDADA
ncbi:MAG TPA: hypothetical protein VNS09_13410 [Solirubrobacter sp.]|nr:hypothetical protein [Solirubrobacter sp.]